jgi:hypothetical protein
MINNGIENGGRQMKTADINTACVRFWNDRNVRKMTAYILFNVVTHSSKPPGKCHLVYVCRVGMHSVETDHWSMVYRQSVWRNVEHH